LVDDRDARWEAHAVFIAEKLTATRGEMGGVILNRMRWEKLRDDCRMLAFLQERAAAGDFQGIREELNRIAEGRLRVAEVSGPRRKATDCLQLWATDLQALDLATSAR